jgi:RsiW-degrading membrane proteinase PrsW (M82 family)
MSGLWVLPVILIISSLPIIAVFVWFRLAKYSFSTVSFLLALLAGAAAFFPALFLQNLPLFTFRSGGKAALFFDIFVRIAFTEEASRLLALVVFFAVSGCVARGKQVELSGGGGAGEDTPEGGTEELSYNAVKKATAVGLVVGLGFAVLESAVYGASDARVLLLRAVTAAPLHGACGARVGAAAVMFRSSPLHALFRVLAAIAIHGVYNFMAAMPGFPSALAVLLALSALITSIAMIRGGWDSMDNSPYSA